MKDKLRSNELHILSLIKELDSCKLKKNEKLEESQHKMEELKQLLKEAKEAVF